MFLSREKLFVTCCAALLTFIAPCFAQMGDLGGPVLPGPGQTNSHIEGMSMGSIVGSVRTMDNEPVADARVEVTSLTRGDLMATQYTSPNGGFEVTNLPAGAYELRAESGVLEAAERVQVGEGQNWLTLRMPRPVTAGGSGGSTVSVQQLRVPDKAASFLDKAQKALSQDKLDQAADLVGKALAAYPDYAQALALRGLLEMQAQHYDLATADANRSIQADPNYGMGYLLMGAILNTQQKFKDALAPLGRAEALLPNAWQIYFESSKAYLQLGRFQDALQQVNKAFTLTDPGKQPELHLVKGYAYMGLHTYAAALTELEAYVTQVPAGPHTAQVRSTLAKIRPLAAAAVAP